MKVIKLILVALAAVLGMGAAHAAEPGAGLGTLLDAGKGSASLTPHIRTLVGLSLLSIIPAALIAMTSFTRILVTLAFLRHAIGMPETPPNMVLITLSLFLTFFTMAPVLEQVNRNGLTPFLEGSAGTREAIEGGLSPLKEFMTAHVREEDLASVAELAKSPLPDEVKDVPMQILVPAFMLSELRAAFAAGFIIFLPFLLIDLIVAAVLMSLGMMMVPPVSISLPLKVLLFVLIDGWTLLLRAIAGAYA